MFGSIRNVLNGKACKGLADMYESLLLLNDDLAVYQADDDTYLDNIKSDVLSRPKEKDDCPGKLQTIKLKMEPKALDCGVLDFIPGQLRYIT